MRQASLWLPQESCSIPVEAISAKPHTTLHSALFCALPIIAQLFLFVKRICSVFCVKKFSTIFFQLCAKLWKTLWIVRKTCIFLPKYAIFRAFMQKSCGKLLACDSLLL